MNTQNEIFGDPADFAIEVGLDYESIDSMSLWGHMRVWCCWTPLGNIENRCCGLDPTYFYKMATKIDELWDESLAGLDDHAIWSHLDSALYGYYGDIELKDDRTSAEIENDSLRYSKFDFLTNWGESFDGYKAFLIAPTNKPLRILSRTIPSGEVLVMNVSRASFIKASNEFYDWYQSQSQVRKSQRNAEP